MDEIQCVAFLEALRAKQIRVKSNGWVEASCVLAPWLHKHHADHTPSFGLSISPGGRSYFMCFACRQGSAEELLHSLEMYSHASPNYDFKRCHQILADEQFVVPLPAYGEFHKPEQVFIEWPSYWLDSFQKVGWVTDAIEYLNYRGVSQTIWVQFDLRYDTKHQRIVAPYWDVFGRFAGARGRSIVDQQKKHYDYSWQGANNARLVWYGEQSLNLPGPVVVVEGQFDVMRVAQAFPKVVGALTSKPTLEKMKKLSSSQRVIQIPDRDEAGDQSVFVYAKYCQQLGLQHRVAYLGEGVKDPAECHPDYLRDRIEEHLK